MFRNHIAISASGLIFNPDTGESFTVNPMAAEIINMMKEGLQNKEVVKAVTAKYHVEPSAFERDLEDFVQLLRNYTLVGDDA